MAVFHFEQLSFDELQRVRTVPLAEGPTGIYELVSCLQHFNNALGLTVVHNDLSFAPAGIICGPQLRYIA